MNLFAYRELGFMASKIWGARRDLQEVFSDSNNPEFWVWLNVHGIQEYEQVKRLLPAVPPQEQQAIVNIGSGQTAFLGNGATCYLMLVNVASEVGFNWEATKVLDFGCGCGRVIRFFLQHSKLSRFYGTDPNPRAIEWCQKNLLFARFVVGSAIPPLAYTGGDFDLIYSISVFSHLSEANHFAWLAELSRICRPGRWVIVTTHGLGALERAATDAEARNALGLSWEKLASAKERLNADGFCFVPTQERLKHLNPDLYGLAFISEHYIRRHWTQWFHVHSFHPVLLDNWQDVVVLQAS